MYAYDAAGEGLSRHEPAFETASLVGRGDVHPWISMPNFIRGWTLRPELGLDETIYSQRLLPASSTNPLPQAINEAINRNVLHTSFEIRPPTLGKIFDHKPFGYVFKHTIEPYVVYRYQTGISNFSRHHSLRLPRYPLRHQRGGVRCGQPAVRQKDPFLRSSASTNRFTFPLEPISPTRNGPKRRRRRRRTATATTAMARPRKSSSWTLAQKYFFDPTFGGAVVNGARNVFDTSADFSGIAYIYGPRRFSPIISRLSFRKATAP